MNRNTRKILIWLVIGGAPPLVVSALMVMLAFLLLVMIASFSASLFGNGVQFGGQGSEQQITTSQKWTGQENKAVVAAALSLVSRLYNCGSANHTQCYESMPATDIDLWASACPLGSGCFSYWQSGDFQCVTFITGVYHNAGQDVPDAPDAKYFWTDPKFTSPDWEHISNTSMPEPGDIGVLSGPTQYSAGHVFIITDVVPPLNASPGYVQFAQGNALVGIATEPLIQQSGNITMNIWAGYSVLGYLRHLT